MSCERPDFGAGADQSSVKLQFISSTCDKNRISHEKFVMDVFVKEVFVMKSCSKIFAVRKCTWSKEVKFAALHVGEPTWSPLSPLPHVLTGKPLVLPNRPVKDMVMLEA